MKSYKELIVWLKSVDPSKEVYALSEKYNLISQLNRYTISIHSNIAEGRHRGTRKDFSQYYHFAYGSATVLETPITIIKQLPFGDNLNYNKVDGLLYEIMKMLRVIITKLKAPSQKL